MIAVLIHNKARIGFLALLLCVEKLELFRLRALLVVALFFGPRRILRAPGATGQVNNSDDDDGKRVVSTMAPHTLWWAW